MADLLLLRTDSVNQLIPLACCACQMTEDEYESLERNTSQSIIELSSAICLNLASMLLNFVMVGAGIDLPMPNFYSNIFLMDYTDSTMKQNVLLTDFIFCPIVLLSLSIPSWTTNCNMCREQCIRPMKMQ